MTEESVDKVKQIIVIRKDLNMRRGKEIAQGAHAAMAFLLEGLDRRSSPQYLDLTEAEWTWIDGLYAKVTLQVDSEAALVQIYETAKAAGLKAHLIEDHGLTEFAGVLTKTAVGIGPDYASKIDPVCRHLKLY